MIIEDLITSKTRVKILKLFLTDIEHRYYLRELERMLEESLSPLRRQLVKLVKMGILDVEEEANLKYYSLNKNFQGLEELRKLVLGVEVVPAAAPTSEVDKVAMKKIEKQFRYDAMVLTAVSIFIVMAVALIGYLSIKNIHIANKVFYKIANINGSKQHQVIPANIRNSNSDGSMASRNWKLVP